MLTTLRARSGGLEARRVPPLALILIVWEIFTAHPALPHRYGSRLRMCFVWSLFPADVV